ncbi:MAG: two pore domain potassium channel family protein [Pyrinomonadaceae bacterium]|nr:two pore domain potassium channel family protein [Pyrinomonadaceae bacterium]
MSALLVIIGCALLFAILWDAFESIVLPRRVTRRFRLTRGFYRTTWVPWRMLAQSIHSKKQHETVLSYFGPLSLIVLLCVWAFGLIVAYAMIQWALQSPVNAPEGVATFGTYLYMSGETFVTLGYGDVSPRESLGRFISVAEAATGLGFVAMIIGYLPILSQAFSRREVSISLLDARAGSPPSASELLRRHGEGNNLDELNSLLREWERWAAELMESHLSYPVLSYFRSQHDNQSWLAALTTVLDTCALVMTGVRGAPSRQARLTFAMARHAMVDLSQVFLTPPLAPEPDRLPHERFLQLRDALASAGVTLCNEPTAEARLAELRGMYEPYVNALAELLLFDLPAWIHVTEKTDNWQTSAWGRASANGHTVTALPLQAVEDDHF